MTDDWYARNGCTHGHCPRLHEKPQPVQTVDGRLICSRCAVEDSVETDMIPCTSDVCD